MKGVTVPEHIIRSAGMSEQELIEEIAIMLFKKEKLTLAQASKLAKRSQIQFQHLLASRGISIHYGIEDFEHDIATLKGLGRL